MKLNKATVLYLLSFGLAGGYFFWRMFVKMGGSELTPWYVVIFTTYILLSAVLFFPRLSDPLFTKLKPLSDPRIFMAATVVVVLAFFSIVRHDGLMEPVLNEEGRPTGFIVWKNSQSELMPVKDVKWEDESKNFSMSQTLHKHGSLNFVELYTPNRLQSKVYEAHPPLFSVFMTEASFFLSWFGINQSVAMRLLVVLMMLANTWLVFLIYKEIMDEQAGLWVAAIFLSFAYFFFYFGCRAQNDHMITLFSLLFALINVRLFKKPSLRLALVGGLMLGLAFWTKYTALLALASIGFIWCFFVRDAPFSRRLKLVGVQAVVGGLIFALWIHLLQGTPLGELQYGRYVEKLLGRVLDPSNIGQARSGGRGGIMTMALNMPFDLGLPQMMLLVIGLAATLVSKELRRYGVWIACWLGIYFAATFLVIPKLNYTLPAAHALACLVVLGARFLPESRRMTIVLLCQCLLVGAIKLSIWTVEG